MHFLLPKNIRFSKLAQISKEKLKVLFKLNSTEEPPAVLAAPPALPEITNLTRIDTRGMSMPIIGYGTWQIESPFVDSSLAYALETGYRHIDTAYSYGIEENIGYSLENAIKDGIVQREDLFISSKLPFYGMTADGVKYYVDQSLKNLRTPYLDLYLIHFPVGVRLQEDNYVPDPDTDHLQIWRALEEQVCEGKIKNLGVSNFSISQIKRIMNFAKIAPSNVQVELHLYHQQKEMWVFCAENSMGLTAYAPLGSPGLDHFLMVHDLNFSNVPMPLKNRDVGRIAKKHKKTAAQIMLRYLIQNGIAVIPKSRNPDRIVRNFNIFDFVLDPADMSDLAKLDMGVQGRMFAQVWEGTEKHKDYPF